MPRPALTDGPGRRTVASCTVARCAVASRAVARRHRLAVAALAAPVAFAVLGLFAHPASASAEHPRAVTAVLTSATAGSSTTSGTSTTGGNGGTPAPIQVGPTPTGTPGVPASGSGGSVSAGTQPSPGFFDIPGQIEAALDGWFRSVVTDALNPVLEVMGHTLLATPEVTDQSRVGQLWEMSVGIADACLVLFVLVGGAIVMGHETVQTRTAIKDVLPRIVVAAVAVNASLSLAGLAISTADSFSQALLGQGVDPSQAAVVLRQLVIGSLASGGIFLVLLGAVVAVLAVVLLATYVIRLALVILLVVAAPLALVCHALPQTEGLARLWWRGFAGALLVQVAQSLVLICALRIFLASGGPANLGIASSGGLVDLLVSACLCWVLVKIPTWVGRMVFAGGRRHGGARSMVRDLVVYKGIKALAAGIGL
ncbi:MAG: hypothetical protein M0010_06855 [Actinomycetota bacterium]|jgi:hypothetical protein|nr:hypothetical protein [Actinomycetota bacterium]MDA8357689.1 hypothetical protein [Actinomycetota bacterium]